MLGYYINDLVQRLNTKTEEEGWQVRELQIRIAFRINHVYRKLRRLCIVLCPFKKQST